MDADIELYLTRKLKVGRSSHPGHRTEFEIRDKDDNHLRLNFDSEKTLDRFYEAFGKFYRECKEFYERRRKKGLE